MFLWLCQLGSGEAAIWLLSSCHQIWLKANRRWLQGKSAAIGRGRIRRCFSVGEASTVRYFGVIIGSIGWQSGETIILGARIFQVATSWLSLPGQSHVYVYILWVADKITYYPQSTWPKWVVHYRMLMFSHKFKHPMPTPHYFSLPLILSVAHI